MFLHTNNQHFTYDNRNKYKQYIMNSTPNTRSTDTDDSEEDCNDRKSTTSSRSKDGRFVKTGSRTVHPCPHAECIKYFTRPSRLQTHLLSHTGEHPYKCTKDGCSKTYSRSAHLKRHMLKSHAKDKVSSANEKQKIGALENTLSCSKCPKVFANKYSLQKHLKVHQDPMRYICPHCNKSFHKHHFLSSHISLEHNEATKETKVACTKCDKRFAYKSQLQRHYSRHHEKLKTYRCDNCDEIFSKWTSLRTHIASVHPKVGKNSCEICHKVFSGPSASGNLQSHRATHGETRKVYYCPIKPCTRFYYAEKNLNDHVTGYHEGKRFPCMETGCSSRLSSRRKLIQHMQAVHSSLSKLPKAPSSKKRAPRFDKGTVKTSMAANLSKIGIHDNLECKKEQGESKSTKVLDPTIDEEVPLSSLPGTKEHQEVSSELRSKHPKKKKARPAKEIFGLQENYPVFTLPGCKRTTKLIKSLKSEKMPPYCDKKDEYLPSLSNATPASNLSLPTSDISKAHNNPEGTKPGKRKLFDFSKYVVISTSNYKSSN